MIGTWNFTSQFRNELFKGTVTYRSDKSFVRKITYSKKNNYGTSKSGGTVRGTWQVTNYNKWLEINKECNFAPDKDVCHFFKDTISYGERDSDLWDCRVIYKKVIFILR